MFLQRLKFTIGQCESRIWGCNWLKQPSLTQINYTVVELHSQTLSFCSLFLCVQVKSEYAKLKETLGAVTQERNLALWERNQLQDKLENLEQVLKVRMPALRGALTPLFVSTLCALLSVVVFLSWDRNSGVFMEPNPLPLLLPMLQCLHLVTF